MTDDPIAMQARHEAELDAANERIRQLEAENEALRATLKLVGEERGLTIDGICGPSTWGCLFRYSYQPAAA